MTEELEKLGVECRVLSGRDHRTLFKCLCGLYWCDILFLQKGYTRWHYYLATVAKILGKKVVLDFDDKYSTINSEKTLKYMIAVLNRVDLAIVGSEGLLKFALQYQPNSILVPSSIRLASYVPAVTGKAEASTCVLGWIGNGRQYFRDLQKILRDPIITLASRTRLKLKIVGACGQPEIYDAFTGISNLETEFIDSIDWADHVAVSESMADFDIGLYPLSDNDYNIHKCGFKALEYMAMGIPVVASPVGANQSIVIDGENGYLADSPESWKTRLLQLAEDDGLRERMGRAGRQKVRKHFSVEAAARSVYRQCIKLEMKQGAN